MKVGRLMLWDAPWSWVFFILAFTTGCSSSIYGWQVRTSSTAMSSTFDSAMLGQEPVAVLGGLTMPGLRGNEVGLDIMLGQILNKVAPQLHLVSMQHTISKINQQGLTPEYTQMRADAEQSHILNRETLRKVGKAIGARYVFQPRLAAFTQIMYDRWTFPAFGVVISQTRQSNLRMSVQLWDAQTGEIVNALGGPDNDITDLAFSADGRSLVGAAAEGIGVTVAPGLPIRIAALLGQCGRLPPAA